MERKQKHGNEIHTDAHDEEAYRLALLGLTDEQVAKGLGVSRATVQRWKRRHVRFAAALSRGRQAADVEVANALYRAAVGYVDEDGKRFQPNVPAAIFWLRARAGWRDRDPSVTTVTNNTIACDVRTGIPRAPGSKVLDVVPENRLTEKARVCDTEDDG